jgi:hypothetical protein
MTLGTSASKTEEATDFTQKNRCDGTILNGDIIDNWQLRKYGSWQSTRRFSAPFTMWTKRTKSSTFGNR